MAKVCTYKNDDPFSLGKCTWDDGRIYEGDFVNNKMEGTGMEHHELPSIYKEL